MVKTSCLFNRIWIWCYFLPILRYEFFWPRASAQGPKSLFVGICSDILLSGPWADLAITFYTFRYFFILFYTFFNVASGQDPDAIWSFFVNETIRTFKNILASVGKYLDVEKISKKSTACLEKPNFLQISSRITMFHESFFIFLLRNHLKGLF